MDFKLTWTLCGFTLYIDIGYARLIEIEVTLTLQAYNFIHVI